MKEWLGDAGENKLSDWDISATRPLRLRDPRRRALLLLSGWTRPSATSPASRTSRPRNPDIDFGRLH